MNTTEAINITVRLAREAIINNDLDNAINLLNNAIFLMLDSDYVTEEVNRKIKEYGYEK